MKISHKDWLNSMRPVLLLMLMVLGLPLISTAQERYYVSGTIYEALPNGGRAPLVGAVITFPEYGIGAASDINGRYSIRNVSSGRATIVVSYVGKVSIDSLIIVGQDTTLDFTLQEDNFSLKEIVVTARPNETRQATSSLISSSAMEHLQAVSLSDLTALLPGGISKNPTLSYASKLTIRNAGLNSALNSLGTAIIQDGAPVSNNANLQATNPSIAGATAALAGGAAPSEGIDARGITLGNIERVEVIRGIPSAEHGDLTSGAVIITSKAGHSPFYLSLKANRNVLQSSAQKGFDLGKKRGALNVDLDYARNIHNPSSNYLHYNRYSGKLLYSNTLWDNKWRTNTSITVVQGVDQRDRNPDDEKTMRESQGRDTRFVLNTNGTLFLNRGWLKNIRYVLSANYSDKYSFYQEQYVAANAPYSMTSVDGAILGNAPGKQVFDNEGNEITNLKGVDPSHFANFLPSTYLSKQEIYGRELGFFAKLNATFAGTLGATKHRIMLGADFRSDGNIGAGKTFDPKTPPYRILSALNATFRPRPYKDIPFINHLGLYAEENFSLNFSEEMELKLQVGLRWDYMPKVKGIFTPRINASVELIPDELYLRGGYGVAAKMPTLLYLYPEPAYFEFVNINELPQNVTEPLFMTTTRVFDTDNKDLAIATNQKAEIGVDWNTSWAKMGLTLFTEQMENGYSLYPCYAPVIYKTYGRATDTPAPTFNETGAYPVLAGYYSPSNTSTINTKGIEWELYFKRIDAIRTTFSFTGAWMSTESYNNSYTHYDRSGENPATRTHVGLYEPGMQKVVRERLTSALRATHNIPQLGLVLTLTGEAIWHEKDFYKMGNDTIPVAYISKLDGKVYPYDVSKIEEPEFASILMRRNDALYIAESYPPFFNFNINVTKEIGNFMRLSFFANNMFRSYPKAESKRYPGSYTVRNKDFFFGLEVNIIIP